MSTSTSLHLPIEILFHILREWADGTTLWTSLRHVSHTFRNEVESIFLPRYLPQTLIHIYPGTLGSFSYPSRSQIHDQYLPQATPDAPTFYDDQYSSLEIEISLRFSHLSRSDATTAVFTVEIDGEYREEYRCNSPHRWLHEHTAQDPKCIVQIGREINDTTIIPPDLEFVPHLSDGKLDPAQSVSLRVQLDWHEVATNFYNEQAYYERLMMESMGEHESLAQQQNDDYLPCQSADAHARKAWARVSAMNREKARRRRLLWQLQKKYAAGEIEEQFSLIVDVCERDARERMENLRGRLARADADGGPLEKYPLRIVPVYHYLP